ncbi:MAG: cyclic lactone autoinducer peptide [Lachnospiraceae bacterium]
MKKRNWMNKLSGKTMNIMAAMALMVTAVATNRCCMWYFGQDKMPSGCEKLRKF